MKRQGDDGIRDKFRNPNSAIRNRKTILNVDDDDASRYAVSHILHQAGFEVMEAASGMEALRLSKENPDLVILDVHLPDMSGLEVCRRIKADPATSLMPVLMLSATYRDDQSRVKGLDSGADGYLTQPVEPQVLISTVKALLRIRQAEAELQAAAREWRTTFDTIGDAVCLMDGKEMILRCNQAMTKLLGKPFDKITGRTCWELVHGTSEPIEGCPIVRMKETRRRESLILPMGERWLEVCADPLLDEAGDLIGSVHIMSDITKRKRAEEALQESEKKYRALFENMAQGAFYQRADGVLVDGNPAVLEMFGLTRDQFLGRTSMDPCWKVIHEDGSDFPGEQHPSMKALRTGKPVRGVVAGVFNPRKEDYVWLSINAIPQFKAGEDRPYQVFVTLHDITERKQVEEALRESEERLQGLFETMAEGMIFITPDGQIAQANPAAERILGLKRSEIEARNYVAPEWEILRPDGTPMPPEEMAGPRAMKEKCLVKDVVMGAKRPDGSISWINVSAAPLINEAGRLEGVVGTFADITERKRAEEELHRRAKELAALQATVLDITAPHDLPTLLQTIVERAALLLNAPAGGLYLCDPDQGEVRCVVSYNTPRDYTETVLKYGEGAAGTVAQTRQPLIIDDYRTWSRRAAVYEEEQPFTSVLSAPMIWQGRVTGVIHVLSDVESRRFTEADLELLTLFANHAAIAVENARLYEEAQQEITERKRAEEALREAEKRYRDLYDNAPVMYHTIDTRGIILECNQTEADMLGYSKEEIIGQPIYAFETREYQDLAPHALREGMEKGHAVGERRFVRKDGTIIDAALDATAIYDDSGQVVGFRATFTDITERKRAEEALQESEEHFRSLVTSASDVITMTDLEGNILFINEAGKILHGVDDLNELIGRNAFSLIAEESLESAREGMEIVLRKGVAKNREYVLVRDDGKKVPVEMTVSVIRDAGGKPFRFMAITRDITERKRAEEELRNAYKQLLDIIEFLPDATFVINVDKKVIAWNHAMEEMTGVHKEEIIGKGDYAYALPFYGVRRPILIDLVLSSDEEIESRYDYIERKGNTLIAEVFLPLMYGGKGGYFWGIAAPLLNGEGKIVGTIESIRDITERKQAEEMKDNLIRDVSHELKTPLAKMQMGVDMLMEMVGAPSIDRQKAAGVSEMIAGNVQRLQHTVNNILDLSSLESGQMPYDKTKLQPKNLIRRVILDMQPLAEGKGLELVAELPKSLPQVKGDQERLLRVLTNLVDNAVKFTDEGKIVISAKKKAHEIEIAVSDSGCGILGKNLDRVFERFWQERASIPGSGVGLAICKTIVEAHDGKIWAESAGRGRGTTIRFTLPIVDD